MRAWVSPRVKTALPCVRGKNAHLAPDGAHVGQAAAVGADAVGEDLGAHDLLIEVVQRIVHLAQAALELLGEVLLALGLDLRLALLALVAVGGFKHPAALVIGVFAHGGLDVLARGDERDLGLLLADFLPDALDEGDQLLDFLMAKEDGAQHQLLGHFLRARLDHEHGVAGAAHGQVQRAPFALGGVGAEDQLAVHAADHHRAGGAAPGDVADGQRRRGPDHRGHFRGDVLVHAQAGGDHLHIVAHALGEQRAQRTVDQAAGERRLLRGTPLALDEAAGNLAHGILLFLKVHAQREEVHALARLLAHGGVDHHHRVAIAHEGRAVGLLRVLAELDRQRAPRQFR